MGAAASSFFVLPSAQTYERVWKSIAQTPMPEGALIVPRWQLFQNVGDKLIKLTTEDGARVAYLHPGNGITMYTDQTIFGKKIGRLTPTMPPGSAFQHLHDGKLLVFAVD